MIVWGGRPNDCACVCVCVCVCVCGVCVCVGVMTVYGGR